MPEVPGLQEQSTTGEALKRFTANTRYHPTEDPERVSRGNFSYHRALEDERIARGRALIRRVDPGAFEDPNYFAMLAYQAASIEMGYCSWVKESERDRFSKFLLGTAHAPDVNAFCTPMPMDEYSVIVVNSGLIEFMYQAAKVVIEAIDPEVSTEPGSRVVTRFSLESVKESLRPESPPVERLYRTLEAYFYSGYPRAAGPEAVPNVQHPPLGLLVDLAERWVIGHEYAHGLASPFMINPPAEANPARAEEFFCDAQSTIATVHSAAMLDGVPPEFPLQSAVFALRCLGTLSRAHSIVMTGALPGPDSGATTHPAARDRARQLIGVFRQYFDVTYDNEKIGFDLALVLRAEPPKEHGFSHDQEQRVYDYSEVLYAVWQLVGARLLEDFRRKRRVHPMWQ